MPNLFGMCSTCVQWWQCVLAPVGVLNAAEPVRRVFDMCLAMAVHIGSSWCVECQTCLVVAVHIDSSWFMYTPPFLIKMIVLICDI